MLEINQSILGETDQLFRFDGRGENYIAAHTMASQCRQSMDLFTHDLEPLVYDREPFLQAARSLVTRNRHTKIRVLVQDSKHAVSHGHRLIEIARRFTSSIELHRPGKEFSGYIEAMLIADGTGFLHKPVATRFEGSANFKGTLRTKELQKIFDEAWDSSQPDQEMRRLYI